jgi:hypothetical protein
MVQEAPARTKIPTKSPQQARGGAAQSSAGRPKAGRMARGRVLASGTGRAATRGGGPVIELECGRLPAASGRRDDRRPLPGRAVQRGDPVVTADQPPPTCTARVPGWVQLAGDAVFGVPRDRGGADR